MSSERLKERPPFHFSSELVFWTTYEILAVAANVNIEEVLKLALDRPPNTTTVTKGGKTGNLFAQSVLGTDDQEDKKR